MDVKIFLEKIQSLGVDFYTGVPDSQLKSLCDTIYQTFGIGDKHIVAANEGGAVGLAAGHYLAVGKPALVYMQNSGIGNVVNPVASLLDEKVYGIPCVFVVGWRGEPNVKDEPQHKFQGEITIELLELLKIKCFVLSAKTTLEELEFYIEESKKMLSENKSVAFVVKKDGLTSDIKQSYQNEYTMKRENALKVIAQSAGEADIFVSTTGKTSRELFEIREQNGQGHEKDFLTVGSMGHASMIAMGIALEKKDRTVWCIDGDGAAIMHLGSMLISTKTHCRNLIHVIFNNGAHETVGGMPVAGGAVDFCKLASAAGYEKCFKAYNEQELKICMEKAKEAEGTKFIEVMVALGSRKDLGRPTTTPQQNKERFMQFLEGAEKNESTDI